MKKLQSQLLIADPHLPDSNFFRSVVLMIKHDDEGAFGVVLNRPSDVRLKDVWGQLSDQPCQCNDLINLGGPVDGPLLALHTHPLFSESEVLPGVFVATQKVNLDAVVAQSEYPFKIFSGYSGWGTGQLESELEAGGWLSLPANYDHIFEMSTSNLWRYVTGEIGRQIILPGIDHEQIPDDPSVN